ncbi:MAG TPA: hypothetical protein VGM95_02650 [Lactobacillaceae bacterium]|jgi:hypothetical protein
MSAEKGFVRALGMRSARYFAITTVFFVVADVINTIWNMYQSQGAGIHHAAFSAVIWVAMAFGFVVQFNQLWRESWVQLVPVSVARRYLLSLVVVFLQATLWTGMLVLVEFINGLVYHFELSDIFLTPLSVLLIVVVMMTVTIWMSIITNIGFSVTRFIPKRYGGLVRVGAIVLLSWLASVGFGFIIHQLIRLFEHQLASLLWWTNIAIVADVIGVIIAIYLLKNWVESRVR